MSPLVRRTLVSTLVVGALSITLFAAPAHAAGAKDYGWQGTTSWSVFSLDFWMDFASSLFGVDLGGDEAVATSDPAPTGTIYERLSISGEPNGVYATGAVSPDGSATLAEGQN